MTCDVVSHCRRKGYFAYLLLLISVVLGFLPEYSEAQTPFVTRLSAYTCIGESTLYIHGGLGDFSNPVNQLFALDLTQPWTTSSPIWKNLTTADSPTDYAHTITPTGDQKSLFVWGFKSEVSSYSLSSQTWSNVNISGVNYTTSGGLVAVTDPASGIMYIPAGSKYSYSVLVYNPATGQGDSPTMTSGLRSSLFQNYGAVWSPQNSSVFMYGGTSNSSINPSYVTTLYILRTPDDVWSGLQTTGTPPTGMKNHCMATAYNGSKVIVFGGATPAGVSSNISIWDADTMNWTQGKSADPSLARYGMACGVSGDYLIIWGGYISSNIGDAMIIYNIKEDQWTTTFTPINSSSTPGASTPTGITDPTQTPNKSSLGAPVGAGVGAVVLVAAIGIFIYFRKKAARRKHQNETREPLPTAWESKNIDKDSMSPPAYPPALEKSKTSVQQNSHITLGNPQNPEYSQGAFLPGTTDLKNPQWAAPGQLHRHSSGPRSPQALQPQESTSRAIEDDILTEEQLEHIIASQLRLQQQQLLHQQEMERIRIEQEALLVKLKQKLKA